jgi:hypothetical protein
MKIYSIYKSFYFILILFLIIFISCHKEEDTLPPGWQYGPGPLIYSPYIEAKINGNLIRADQEFAFITYQTSKYDSANQHLVIGRYLNPPGIGPTFEIEGKNISPFGNDTTTFWPGPNDMIPQVTLSYLAGTNRYFYNPNDTSLFSITINHFSKNKIYGTFSGKLFNNNDSVNVTNGKFDINLK